MNDMEFNSMQHTPAYLKNFNLLEGMPQPDGSVVYWNNFTGFDWFSVYNMVHFMKDFEIDHINEKRETINSSIRKVNEKKVKTGEAPIRLLELIPGRGALGQYVRAQMRGSGETVQEIPVIKFAPLDPTDMGF
jgi:hypothetical protein